MIDSLAAFAEAVFFGAAQAVVDGILIVRSWLGPFRGAVPAVLLGGSIILLALYTPNRKR